MDTKKIRLKEFRKLVERIIEEEIQNEGYKWKPSASQRRAFAQKMQDPAERAAYEKRKEDKMAKNRSNSKFDYYSAGGNYIPTQSQYDFVMRHMELFSTSEEQDAANQIMYGYINKEKVHHDFIHIVNEKIRSFNSKIMGL